MVPILEMKNLQITKIKNEINKLKIFFICAGVFFVVLVGIFFSLQAEVADASEEATGSAEATSSAEAKEEIPIMQLGNAAPEKSALGISPAIIELILERGGTREKKISVFNVTNFPLPVKGKAESFFVVEDLEPGAEEIFDVSSWITIEPADFILQPQEKKEIQVTINVPEEAEPGGHYAALYFQPLIPVEVLSPQTAFLTARVGTLGFFVVKGEIVEEAELEEIEVARVQQFGPVDFGIPIKNSGNVHILPSGKITVTDIFGREREAIELAPTTVLPHTSKVIEGQWEKKFLLGRFVVEAEVSYGSPGRELTAGPVVFWVVPWVFLLGGGGLLTIILFFCIMFRKRAVLAFRVLFGLADARELMGKDSKGKGINLLPRNRNNV